jgi:Flp pilus assembly pilin Flp
MDGRENSPASRAERGAVLLEYGLLVTLIAIVVYFAAQAFGVGVSALFATFPALFP